MTDEVSPEPIDLGKVIGSCQCISFPNISYLKEIKTEKNW
jgi:hypothetical protein